jgi:hypothetical protein
MRGALTVSNLRKLLGLLHHIVFMLALPSHTMYRLYDGLEHLDNSSGIEGAAAVRTHNEEEIDDHRLVPITPRALAAFN